MSERVWVWVGHMGLGPRIQTVLEEYGDRLTDVSIFGWSVSAQGALRETFNPNLLDPYREKWPHIRWWGCFRNMDDPNDGPFAIFEALRSSEAARDRLSDDTAQMFTDYPWLTGIDIDLETGGNQRSAESEEIFRRVANRAHSMGKLCGAALPPLTSTGSVGGENWVRYRQLGEILDVVEIMSYDFSWAGSAPGPISPGFWLEDVYNWVSSQVTPSKVYMGVPLYAYYWRLHDTPPNLGQQWRGISGTYYSFWQQFTGITPWYDEETQPLAGWISYRDEESKSLWGFLGAYDWLEPGMWEESFNVERDRFSGKNYGVRYGRPAGIPQWSVADNSAGDARADYLLHPREIVDVHGNSNGPYRGFTLTMEMLKREPVAATIIDDYATSEQQLGTVYTRPDGENTWSYFEVTPVYKQYRGSGRLQYNNGFGSTSLYVQGRAQFATAGTFSVYSQGFRAELRNDGRLRLYRAEEMIEETFVTSRGVGLAAQAGQAVLGLRVRENSARVYFSTSEEGRVPNPIEVLDVTPPGGPTGFDATATVWLDHTYLGHGWWYMPREAVEVTIDGVSRVMGRRTRTGNTWNSSNQFRPNDDVNEWETRVEEWEEYSNLDWAYEHWVNAPLVMGQQSNVRVVPTDHDVWWGRMIAFDRDGGIIGYVNDAQAVVHWRGRAEHDWGLAGIAAWSLGQEDVRMWDYFAGGELSQESKILNG